MTKIQSPARIGSPRFDDFSTFYHDVTDESPQKGAHWNAETHTMTQTAEKTMSQNPPLTLFTTMTHHMIHLGKISML